MSTRSYRQGIYSIYPAGYVVDKSFLITIILTEIEQNDSIMHTHGVKMFFCTRPFFVFNDEGAAAKEPTELFIKNTGLC